MEGWSATWKKIASDLNLVLTMNLGILKLVMFFFLIQKMFQKCFWGTNVFLGLEI